MAAGNGLNNADAWTPYLLNLPVELLYDIIRLTDSTTCLLLLTCRYGFRLVSVLRSQDNKATTPIIEAAKRNREQLIQLLLEETEIDPDYKDKNGKTALSYAADKGYTKIAEMLLTSGRVNPGIRDLWFATRGGHEAIVVWLLEIEPPICDQESGSSLLCEAARRGYRGIVERLLATDGIDPDGTNHHSQRPLSLAAAAGHTMIVELIGSRADANLKDENGWTALSAAACNRHACAVERLLTIPGVDVNSKDKYGRTPLSVAAELGRLNIVEMLVRENADIEIADANGRTPLMSAEEKGRERVVNLIQEGAVFSLSTQARIYWRKAALWREYGMVLLVLGYLVGSVISVAM